VLTQLGERPGCALLLDEPTAALDPHHQHRVLGLARQVAAAGHAVVVVLHDLATAARVADRVAVMHQGRLLALAPPADALRTELLAEAYGVPFEVRLDGAGRPIPLAIHPARTESVNQPHLTV
jgi:iron complex transport system ATP-binding protein